jgi:hypothetical protein
MIPNKQLKGGCCMKKLLVSGLVAGLCAVGASGDTGNTGVMVRTIREKFMEVQYGSDVSTRLGKALADGTGNITNNEINRQQCQEDVR